MAVDPKTARPHVLLLEPEAALRRLLDVALSTAGFRVSAPEAIEGPVELVAKHQPDVVVMSFEGPSDLSLLAEIKERFGLPVLVTTLLSDKQARVYALEAGADDFLLKSQDIDEVAERLSFILGAPKERAGATLTLVVGGNTIEIDHQHRLVKHNGAELKLNRSEWALLAELAERPGEPSFDGELLVKVFGSDYRSESAYLSLWVERLQKKLGDDPNAPRLVRRYHGAGYVFAADESAEGSAAG